MQKILVLCDRIPPEHSATGKIEYHIAKELSQRTQVHLVCLAQERREYAEQELYIHTVQSRYGKYRQLVEQAQTKRGLCKLLQKVKYRIYYQIAQRMGADEVKDHKRQLIRTCHRIIKEQKINTLLVASNPFANQEIAAQLVKKNPGLRWYAHMMDSSRHNAVSANGAEHERRILSDTRKIFAMPVLGYDTDFCADFQDKLLFLDLPIIPIKAGGIRQQTENKATVDYIYTGLFYKEIRNPENLLKVFSSLPKNHILHLYSRGCEDILKSYQQALGQKLQIHGFVDTQALEKAVAEADVLINIGNTVANQVPSKVYEYIAAGKPVLSFYQNEDDLSLAHLKKYPLAFSLPYEKWQQELNSIMVWLENLPKEPLSYEQATADLKEKRLSSVSDIIWQFLQL